MTLGGYKFSGKHCQRGTLTDTEWCLLIHKTRLKAFLDASTLASADWAFDQTSGDTSFETYGNVIYTLDSLGYNYVSFMKHGSTNPTYIAILTTCYWGNTEDLANGIINGPWLIKTTDTYGMYICANHSMSHRLSQTQLTVSNIFTDINNTSPLIPVGAHVATSSNYGMYISKPQSFPNSNSLYIGYAIKDELIITWTGTDSIASKLHFSILASHGFNNLKIKNDNNNWFVMVPEGESSNSTSYGEAMDRVVDMNCGVAFAPDKYGAYNRITFAYNADAIFTTDSTANAVPYMCVSAFGTPDDLANTLIKGDVKIDLFAVNLCATAIANSQLYKTFANGNLIYYRASNRGPVSQITLNYNWKSLDYYCMVYLGWDRSNPDILQSSSWQEYM